jgi:hypothetical protein
MKLTKPVCATVLSLFLLPGCGSDSNSGDTGTGGSGGLGGSSGTYGTGGTTPSSGGTTSSNGGTTSSNGGVIGSGGVISSGGATSAGGTAGTAGNAGAAGNAGNAGTAGNGGTAGAAGNAGAAGTAGNAGAAGHAGNNGADGGEPDGGETPDASTPDGGAEVDAAVNCTGATTVDVTKDGSVAASSTSTSLSNRWVATRAVDGDVTTGWYGGNTRNDVTFTWTGTADDCITQIDITQTAMVMNRADENYQSVIVDVLSATGTTPLFTQTVSLTGQPAPNPVVNVSNGGVVGRRVRLAFSGLPQGQTTGGMAELNVKAKR